MRIKLTPVQISTLAEYLPEWCETADIVLGKSYADIEDSDVAEVLRAYEDEMSGRVGVTAPARRVHAMLADAVAALPSESAADSPNEGPEGKDTGDYFSAGGAGTVTAGGERVQGPSVPELPHPLMMAAAAIARGEYGDEARRLAEGMDDRPGERQTRWLARLRHKLNSAGLFEAADAIRLVPDI